MTHILENQVKNIKEWFVYWRNLPGKLELAEVEIANLKEQIADNVRQLNDFVSVENEYIEMRKEYNKFKDSLKAPSVLDASHWNNKWKQSRVYYSAPKRKLAKSYLKYVPVIEVQLIADKIIEKYELTGVNVDDIPLSVMRWLETQFKAKKYRYVKDKRENWQSPSETLERGLGDCDDWGILEYNIIREIFLMLNLWDKHKHRLKCVVGNVNRYGPIPSSTGGHFYLMWLHSDVEWYTIESTYFRPKAILNYGVNPMKLNPAYGTIWFTMTEDFSFAQNSLTISKKDFKKK